MFEGILAKFLNKLLGKYISNLENKQLEVAVWKGDVKMSNLVIRQDAFQQLDIPFQITDGILKTISFCRSFGITAYRNSVEITKV